MSEKKTIDRVEAMVSSFQKQLEQIDVEAVSAEVKKRGGTTAELNCFGTAGTAGSLSGCFGTAGTFGSLGAKEITAGTQRKTVRKKGLTRKKVNKRSR